METVVTLSLMMGLDIFGVAVLIYTTGSGNRWWFIAHTGHDSGAPLAASGRVFGTYWGFLMHMTVSIAFSSLLAFSYLEFRKHVASDSLGTLALFFGYAWVIAAVGCLVWMFVGLHMLRAVLALSR